MLITFGYQQHRCVIGVPVRDGGVPQWAGSVRPLVSDLQ
jgi:hypothetical protein